MKGAAGEYPRLAHPGNEEGELGSTRHAQNPAMKRGSLEVGRNPGSWRLCSDMPNKVATRRRDVEIARIAGRQHGVITRAQLLSAGLLPSGISDRVSAGRLHRIHRGVYAVGHTNIGNEGQWIAAVLACGQGAVLSHQSAAALWKIAPVIAMVDVTVAGGGGRAARKEIRLHRSRTLSPADCTLRAGIPVTKPARTLQDLRRILPTKKFARALREAEYLRLPIRDAFKPDRTRTDLEALFLALARRHRLAQPEVNVRVDRFRVDFLWRNERLVVEVDGWESHRMRSAFEEDRARDARLKVLGYEVLRFTWRQVEDDAATVVQTVRELLQR
jgi:very-short-patch-repair endonuclease